MAKPTKQKAALPLFFIILLPALFLISTGCGHRPMTGSARSLYETAEKNYRQQNFSDAIEIYQQIQNEY
ncbi:MAG: hypothetical protein DRH04_08855, partial [Deltaproteobacteria bacterium]